MAGAIGAFIWKAVVGTVISYAVNAVTNKLFGAKNDSNNNSSSPTYSIGTLQTQTNSDMVMAILYGKVKCAGNNFWQSDAATTVYRLVGFGIGKNYRVSEVKLDDVDIANCPGCSYTAYMGDGEQAIDSRVTGATQVDKAKLVGGMKYDAYLALTITGSDKISSNPNLTAVWEGRVVKIWDTTTVYHEAWSDNVWCMLDFMTSIDGCNIPLDDIDIQSFITAAEYAQPADNSRKWSVNLILDVKKSRQDWLNEMLLCFRAWRTYQNGKHGILIDKPEPVSQVFKVKKTETIQIDWQESSEDVERIILKYRDPDYEWQNVGAPATMKAPFQNATYNVDGSVLSNGTPLSKTVEVNGITNFKQASQHSWFYLNQAQTCGEYITYTCNKRALNRTIGDVIGIFDPITEVTEPGRDHKRYRILGMTEPQGISIQLYCREYNEALYTDQLGSVAPVINITKLPNTSQEPPAVTNLTATEYGWMTADGVHVSNIDIDCTPSNYFDRVSYVITISADNGDTWRYINTISQFPYRIANIQKGNYVVGIQAFNKAGISGVKAATNIIVVGKDNPPPDIETLFIEKMVSGMYRFTFTLANPPIDLAGYKFRYSIGSSAFWDNAIPLHAGLILSSPFDTNILRGGIFTVMGKTVDNSGNESEGTASIIVGFGDPIVNNVVYEQNFTTAGYIGNKTNCSVSGSALVADDNGDLFFPTDDSAPMFGPDNAPFFVANWKVMAYEAEFTPDANGELSFLLDTDGNAQIFYRERYPYQFFGADSDLMFPDDNALMFIEGPYVPYGGKVVANGNSLYDVRIEIGSGTTQGIVREFKAIVDVEDESEVINDIAVTAAGILLPITKTYRKITNVNVDIQDTIGANALTYRTIGRDIGKPFITLYDKNNIAVSGNVDVRIQGIKGDV